MLNRTGLDDGIVIIIRHQILWSFQSNGSLAPPYKFSALGRPPCLLATEALAMYTVTVFTLGISELLTTP